jgi:hypothetical protein
MNGKGKCVWPDGRTYDGEYVDDKKDGYGVYTWPNNKQYRGYWKNGKQHGVGELVSEFG